MKKLPVVSFPLGLAATLTVFFACSSAPSSSVEGPGPNGPGGAGGPEEDGGPSRTDANSGRDASPEAGAGPFRAYHLGEYVASNQTPLPIDAVLTLSSGASTTLQLGTFKPSALTLGVSPDGKRIAMYGQDGTAWVVRVFPLDSQGLPQVAQAVDAATFTPTHSGPTAARIVFSPDGTKIAFASNHASADPDLFQLYAVPAAGGVPVAVASAPNVAEFRWITNTRLFFVDAEPPSPCYRADAPSYAPQLVVASCDGLPRVDAMGRTYFLSPAGSSSMVRRLVGDTVEAEPVPGTRLQDQLGNFCGVDGIAISPEGTRLAFSCAAPVFDREEVWVLNLAQNAATKVSDFGVSSVSAAPIRKLAWHPQGTTIVVEGQNDLYAVPAAGGSHHRIVTKEVGPTYLYDFAFGGDGTLWLNGPLLAGKRAWLFATTSMGAEQDPSSIARFSNVHGSVYSFEVANRSDL